jgi:hypothetical protein
VWLSGYPTPGAVPVDIVGTRPIYLAKAITSALLLSALALTAWLSWRIERKSTNDLQKQGLAIFRLALIPLGAYLLLTPTIHPWYATLVIPLLPFLGNLRPLVKHLWPWAYLSLSVPLSYLTYLDENNLREIGWVRVVEYFPLYFLLLWALLTDLKQRKNSQLRRIFPQ